MMNSSNYMIHNLSNIVDSVTNCTITNGTQFCAALISDSDSDVTKSIAAPSPCSEGTVYARWVESVIITPPIVAFGVIGNILAIIVLNRQKPFLTTSVLLCYLAVVDTLILLAAIPLRTLRYIHVCHGAIPNYNNIYYLYIHRLLYPSLFTLRLAGTWLITILTVDRYIAVCRPLHAQRMITTKLAFKQIIGISIFSILANLPKFFEFHLYEENGRRTYGYRDHATKDWYVFGYNVAFVFLIMYIIPMALMIAFNSNLALGLRMAVKDRALLQRSVSSESSRLINSVTIIVVAIVVTFILCNTLAVISHTLYSLRKCFPSKMANLEHYRTYIATVSDTCVTINSAINFLIYCVFSRSFRNTFMRVFCCCFPKKHSILMTRSQRTRQSNGSQNTSYMSSLLSNGNHQHLSIKLESQKNGVKQHPYK